MRLRAAIERSDRFENRAAFLRHHGLENTTLYRYEVGERTPGVDLVKAFAESLSVSVGELIGEVEVQRVERDGSVSRALAEFLASFDPDDPLRPSKDEAKWLRGISFRELRLAGFEIQPSTYAHVLRNKRLQDSGRISKGQAAEVPDSPDTMDLPDPPRRR